MCMMRKGNVSQAKTDECVLSYIAVILQKTQQAIPSTATLHLSSEMVSTWLTDQTEIYFSNNTQRSMIAINAATFFGCS